MNSKQISAYNRTTALTHVNSFGFIRAQELGLLMWPGKATAEGVPQANARKGYPQACRLLASLLKHELVVRRKLPGCHGHVFVLAQRGVALLLEGGIAAAHGRNIGRTADGVWTPPDTWKHDLISHGALAYLASKGWTIYPEFAIRASGEWSKKIPDGLAVNGPHVLWLETERAEKSGKNYMRFLSEALALAGAGRMPPVFGYRANMAGLAFDIAARDRNGHRLDHKIRVSTGIKKWSSLDTQIAWLGCATENFGVTEVNASLSIVSADMSVRLFDKFEKIGWTKHPNFENSLWIQSYSRFQLIVGLSANGAAKQDRHFWQLNVDGIVGNMEDAANITDAKKLIAGAINRLTQKPKN